MKYKNTGLPQLAKNLTTLENIKEDKELQRCIDKRKYKIVVPVKVLNGQAMKSLYRKKNSKRENLWYGKMGTPRNLLKLRSDIDNSVRHSTPPNEYNHNERDMNEEVIKEKIASDAYRLFSDGLFATPKTRLSDQPIEDDYTKNKLPYSEYIKQYHSCGITHSLRVMSKQVVGYQNFSDIDVPNDNGESDTLSFEDYIEKYEQDNIEKLSFMKYIEKYGRPCEYVIHPKSKKVIPIDGLMTILAVANVLADIDVLGGEGKNCGVVFISYKNDKTSALVVKIDPGEAFKYKVQHDYQTEDTRDIRYCSGGADNKTKEGFIRWEALTEAQKDEFLEANERIESLKSNHDVIDYLLWRDNKWEGTISRERLQPDSNGMIFPNTSDNDSDSLTINLMPEQTQDDHFVQNYYLDTPYNQRDNYQKVLEYLEKALAIQHKTVAITLNNIGLDLF